MRTRQCVSISIDGLLSHFKRNGLDGVISDDGRMLSDLEARQRLKEYQEKGWKLIPPNDCEGFDPFGGGCPGHSLPEAPIEERSKRERFLAGETFRFYQKQHCYRFDSRRKILERNMNDSVVAFVPYALVKYIGELDFDAFTIAPLSNVLGHHWVFEDLVFDRLNPA